MTLTIHHRAPSALRSDYYRPRRVSERARPWADFKGTGIVFDGYSVDMKDGVIDFMTPYDDMPDDVRVYLALVHRMNTCVPPGELDKPIQREEVFAGAIYMSGEMRAGRGRYVTAAQLENHSKSSTPTIPYAIWFELAQMAADDSHSRANGSVMDLVAASHYVSSGPFHSVVKTNVRSFFPFYIKRFNQKQLIAFCRRIYDSSNHPVSLIISREADQLDVEEEMDVGVQLWSKNLFLTPERFVTEGMRRRRAEARGVHYSPEGTDEDDDEFDEEYADYDDSEDVEEVADEQV
ncbi:hypothetical protein IAT38_007279 [Cryptococcus sp. DSM 104549]